MVNSWFPNAAGLVPPTNAEGDAWQRLGIACLTLGICASVAAEPVAIRLTNDSGNPFADAVVYVAAKPSAATRPTGGRTVIRQRGMVFDPFVTVVEKGTAIDFPNEDATLHHVYSFSPAKTFEIKLYKGTPAAPVVFDKPGIVSVGCNVHDWMLAYVVVLDTSLFAKTGADGIARFDDIPKGTHELMVWYPGLREPAGIGKLSSGAGGATPVEFQLKAAPRTRPKAPPRDPMRY